MGGTDLALVGILDSKLALSVSNSGSHILKVLGERSNKRQSLKSTCFSISRALQSFLINVIQKLFCGRNLHCDKTSSM